MWTFDGTRGTPNIAKAGGTDEADSVDHANKDCEFPDRSAKFDPLAAAPTGCLR